MSEIFGDAVPVNPGAFIAGAINEGYGVTAARNLFREAGGAISNETFGQMYGEVRAAIGNRDVIAGLQYDAIPPDEALSTWAAGEADQYATFVTSFVRVPGQREAETRYFTYTSSDPHTPQEAIDAAASFYTDDALVGDSLQGGVYQGSVVTSMTRTVGR